ncbi:ATP synthase F1 subunit gamma [Candidatus Gracilibacteria bacterium]|nr:ATP synthase F1 subunit gamma [Candidatus Gracilibacteria bacterium]
MSNAKEIQRKIGSIKNTSKITKAMELISTVKMKKAQDLALAKKDFVLEMLRVFTRIEEFLKDFIYFRRVDSKKTLAVVITSNKGLCGGYNVNVLKKVNEYAVENSDEDIEYITLGKKAAAFVARTGNTLAADFSPEFTDNIDPRFIKTVTQLIYDKYLTGDYGKVVVFYNYYVNSIKQVPVAREFLPIDDAAVKKYLEDIIDDKDALTEIAHDVTDYIIEPSMEAIAMDVIPMILDMMFYDIVLEAKASEHSARMVAMKAAKDNSKKIADMLTLQYNKARQGMITREVSEIVAGVESLKDA